MFNSLKKILLKTIGRGNFALLAGFYHGLEAFLAALWFGKPGSKLTLIGITGTKGKTTTTIMLGRLLNLSGIRTGYVSTALANTGQGEVINPFKNTTPNGKILNRYLAKMVKNQCKIAVLEMSSQGLDQHRHWGLGKFSTTVFLNLYPEHLEAHGGMENYIKAKGILFKNLRRGGSSVVNWDDEQKQNSKRMLSFRHLRKGQVLKITKSDYNLINSKDNLFYSIDLTKEGEIIPTKTITDFDLHNLFFAYRTACIYQDSKKLEAVLSQVETAPGRMDWVSYKKIIGKKEISVLVDYAHEPASINALNQTISSWKELGLFDYSIHVLSADGAGRDDWKKSEMAKISSKTNNLLILTTDNYNEEDRPEDILQLLASGAKTKYYMEIDRKQAFILALKKAKQSKTKKILIFSTGVGTEQQLTQPYGYLKWDEKSLWAKILDGEKE